MKIKDSEVILNEDEALLIASILQAMLIENNLKIKNGIYLTKNEKEFLGLIKDMVEELETGKII